MCNRSLLCLLLILLAVSCGPASLSPVETSLPTGEVTLTPAVLPEPTWTMQPTETAPPPLAILLAPPGSSVELVERLSSGLAAPLSQAGMRWEVRSDLTTQDLTPELKLVILLPPGVEAASLAAAAPETQFLAVGIPGLAPTSNISLIGVEGERYDQQGFIAGLIAAMITPDWRVGVISVADTAAGKAARQGFLNGVVYFCGLCLPYHGPIFDYPQYAELPLGALEAEWQAAADTLINRAVKTIYIFPQVPAPGLADYLAQFGVRLLGGTQPPEGLNASWVATVTADPLPAALEILPDLLAGRGGFSLPAPIIVQDVNETLFTPGRQATLDKMRLDLLNGVIDTGIDPLTGEAR